MSLYFSELKSGAPTRTHTELRLHLFSFTYPLFSCQNLENQSAVILCNSPKAGGKVGAKVGARYG